MSIDIKLFFELMVDGGNQKGKTIENKALILIPKFLMYNFFTQ